MASASKTPNLNLPQWVGTEKPERTDFNAAFDAIDTTVASSLAEFAKLGSQVMVVARDATLEGLQTIDTINKPKAILIIASHGASRFSIGLWSEYGTAYSTIINLDAQVITSVSTYGQVYIHQTSAGGVGYRGTVKNVTNTGFDIDWSINNPTSYNLTGSVSLRIQVWYG